MQAFDFGGSCLMALSGTPALTLTLSRRERGQDSRRIIRALALSSGSARVAVALLRRAVSRGRRRSARLPHPRSRTQVETSRGLEGRSDRWAVAPLLHWRPELAGRPFGLLWPFPQRVASPRSRV